MPENAHDDNQAQTADGAPQSDAASSESDVGGGKALDPLLLEILVCPSTKKALVYDRDNQELISLSAALAYPVRDGVPIMLIDEARPLTDAEIAKAKAGA